MFKTIFRLFLSIGAINCITRGTNAAEDCPYMVSVRQGWQICGGGSIINEEYILTSANCVSPAINNPALITIEFGITNSYTCRGIVVSVKNIYLHKGYKYDLNSHINVNNIALLQLKSKIQFSRTVHAVQLPRQFQEFAPGTHGKLCGFGRFKRNGDNRPILKKIDLITYSDEKCTRYFGSTFVLSNICAGVPKGGKAPCIGDGGSPLTVKGVQIGVVSLVWDNCGDRTSHWSTFTKVSDYVHWINNIIYYTSSGPSVRNGQKKYKLM